MEIVQKKLILGNCRSRRCSRIPVTLSGQVTTISNNWGMIPCDVLLPNVTGYGSGIVTHFEKGKYRLRYGTMMNNYFWLIKFINNCEYYRLCRNGEEYNYLKVEKDFDDFWSISESQLVQQLDENLPESVRMNAAKKTLFFGKIFCVNSEYNKFKKIHNSIKNAKTFYNLVQSLDKNGRIPRYSFDHQYFDVPLYIQQSVYDGGKLEHSEEEWEEGRIYNVGEVIFKEDSLWSLTAPSEFSTVSNVINDSKKTANEKTKVLFQQSSGQYEEMTTFRGDFNTVTKKLEFNLIHDKTNKPKWVKKDVVIKNKIEQNNEPIKAKSKLYTLTRKKISYTDNGKELPFIIEDNGKITLKYSLKTPINQVTKDNITYCDYITSITLTNDNSTSKQVLKDNIITDIYSKYDTIIFEYIKDGILKDGIVTEGIKYTDKCNISMAISNEVINSKQRTIMYPHIQDSYSTTIEYNTDSYYNNTINLSLFKDDMLIGLHDITLDTGDLTIDRGKSSAFERRTILGEVVTFEDLVNYKNDLFNLNSTT